MIGQEASGNGASTRERAYQAGARVARERIRREAPLDAEALDRVEASDVVVVRGSYDRAQLVLKALEIAHTEVDPEAVGRLHLRPEQLLIVNCPGHLDRDALTGVRRFVEDGGSLFTTDWALRHVLEPAFPGILAYNERPTRDDVVRIEVRSGENPFLAGVMDGEDDPQWWLEGSSYPIRVLAPERVEVLIASSELEARYGEPAVAVLFKHGDGEVFHMISHYYLQRTELRSSRHSMSAVAFAAEKAVPVSPAMASEMDGLSLGDVESAASSSRLISNIVAAKKRRGSRV